MKRTSRQRITITLCVLFAAVVAGDRLIASLFRTAISRSNSALSKAYTGRANADVLVVGNSRAVKSFDVKAMASQLDQSCLNLGTNGMRPRLLHAMLRDYAETNELPERVFVEVSYLKNDWDDSFASDFLLWGQFGEHTMSVLDDRLPRRATASRWIHLQRFGSQQFFRALANRHGNDQLLPFRHSISPAAMSAIEQRSEERFESSTDRLGELALILNQWESQGVEVWLVLAPFLDVYRHKVVNLEQWIKRVETQLDRPILDLSELIDRPHDFADHVHLNRDGQTKMTEFLLQQVQP